MSILTNKKGYSVGFTWVFGLVSLFGIGILFITFDQVFEAHLVPTIKNMVVDTGIDNSTTEKIHNNIDKYMSFWESLPFILFFMIIIYMLIAAFRKEEEGGY